MPHFFPTTHWLRRVLYNHFFRAQIGDVPRADIFGPFREVETFISCIRLSFGISLGVFSLEHFLSVAHFVITFCFRAKVGIELLLFIYLNGLFFALARSTTTVLHFCDGLRLSY